MIVWGGSDANAYFSSGSRYNPSTNSWTPTSSGANVPSARGYHTAVWTGSQMIVWGGMTSDLLYTGGRYDPSTDSWSATSTGLNVPEGRYSHTAVWTGTEMIVWGGANFIQGNYDTGGRYNPSNDSWTPTSTVANLPIGRAHHTAVWTGTEMIVWGGDLGSLPYANTGGRYNPSTDSWTATSTGSNVPPGRAHHTAVWTGTEMIVWGGQDYENGNYNTGGRYNPSADSWTPTSTAANVPTGGSITPRCGRARR
jgi:N-acetylneuraminic acid mutarotase